MGGAGGGGGGGGAPVDPGHCLILAQGAHRGAGRQTGVPPAGVQRRPLQQVPPPPAPGTELLVPVAAARPVVAAPEPAAPHPPAPGASRPASVQRRGRHGRGHTRDAAVSIAILLLLLLFFLRVRGLVR